MFFNFNITLRGMHILIYTIEDRMTSEGSSNAKRSQSVISDYMGHTKVAYNTIR